MATPDPVKNLCEELACPICRGYLKDPVTIACGHNFCQDCLTQCWGESEQEASCPQCREKVQEGYLRRNRQLANVIEIAKELNFQGGRSQWGEEKGRVCEKHREPLKLFCKDHEVSICVVCNKSKEHENHKVIPLEEASEDYKDQIWNLLETLKKKRKKVMSNKAGTEQESQDLLKQIETEKGKTVAEFREMHQFLEKQEKNLLAQMKKAEKEISAKREEHLARLSEEHSSLLNLIQGLEEKHQQPPNELLQDIGSFLQGCEKKEKFGDHVAFPSALKWKIWDFSDLNPFLGGVMKQFRDTLESGLQQHKVKVTLDPDTANPYLILSEDHRSVTCGAKPQNLPDNPKRFDHDTYVLGREEFTGGRHFWEVIVGSEEEWAVGVARKSVGRKGSISYGSQAGVWDMGKWAEAYRASSSTYDDPPLSLREEPKRIRVTLNCEGGRVAFYNADTAALIFEYPSASFSRETLLPFFFVVEKAHLMLSP